MSLLVKGVQVVDGTGRDPYKADVLIQGGLISSVGEIRGRRADQVMEGLGHYLTPGFTDLHARSDSSLSLFENPGQEGFLGQGIVNIIGGQRGFSLAPVIYGTIEAIRHWSDGTGFNTNWQSVKEFLAEVKRFGLGVNFGTFAGHSGVRLDVTNGRKGLGKNEADVIHRVLKEAVREGAFGVSFDLSRWGAKELKDVALAVSRDRGVAMVEVGAEGESYVRAVKEIVNTAKSTKARFVVAGLSPVKGLAKEFKEAVGLIGEAFKKNIDVRFVLQSHPVTEVHIREYLPQALKNMESGEALKKLGDAKHRNAAKKSWQSLDFRNVRVVSAPKHHFLAGKNIVDIAANWNMNYIEAMLRLMHASELQATVARGNLSVSLLRSALAEEAALITADLDWSRTGGGVVANEVACGALPQYFRTVIGEGLVSIEDAVAKVTSVPAGYLNIPGRGSIEEGAPADLVLLSKEDYTVKEVMLGGRVLGKERLEGQVLRHSRY